MKVIVYAPALTGHNGRYTQHILNGLTKLDVPALLVTSQSPCSDKEYEAFTEGLVRMPDVQRLPEVPKFGPPLIRNWRSTLMLRRVLSRERPDWVYIPTADGLAQNLSLIRWTVPGYRRIRIEAVVHNSNFGYEATTWKRRLKASIENLTIRYCGYHRLHFVDNLSHQAFQTEADGSTASAHLPDPIVSPVEISKTEARSQLGLNQSGRMLGIVGYLNRRKGVPLLINSFVDRVDSLPSDARLMLAGRASPDVVELLESEPCQRLLESGRLVWKNEYLSSDEMQLHLFACDAIAACYNGHRGISSFVTQASISGRPIFATDYGWIGWATEALHLGQTVSLDNEASFGRSLDDFYRGELEIADSAVTFVRKFYSEENFQSHLLAEIAAKVGKEDALAAKTLMPPGLFASAANETSTLAKTS